MGLKLTASRMASRHGIGDGHVCRKLPCVGCFISNEKHSYSHAAGYPIRITYYYSRPAFCIWTLELVAMSYFPARACHFNEAHADTLTICPYKKTHLWDYKLRLSAREAHKLEDQDGDAI